VSKRVGGTSGHEVSLVTTKNTMLKIIDAEVMIDGGARVCIQVMYISLIFHYDNQNV